MNNSLDFRKLRDYPVDINSFNCNVADMVSSVYIGPQGTLLESLDAFNQEFGTDLEITKHFTLKPGGYDKIKKAYANYSLRWDMRPRGITSIFRRIDEFRWRGNMMKESAARLESQMLNLRSTGVIWQDNAEDFVTELQRLKTIIIDAIEVCNSLYPNVTVDVKIIPSTTGRINPQLRRNNSFQGRTAFPDFGTPDQSEVSEYIIVFYIRIKDADMTVHSLTSHGDIETYTIPCDDILVASGTYLLPLISRNWGRTTLRSDHASNRNYSYFLEAMYLSPYAINAHPYIRSTDDLYTWELDQYISHNNSICLGNMDKEIRSTLLNSQIEAHITYIVTWLTNYYIPQTNPLNRIHNMRKMGTNITMASYGDPFNNEMMNPDSCSLGDKIASSMYYHAIGENHHNRYGTVFYEPSDPEYILRLEDYIKYVKTADLPCHNCQYLDGCKQQVNVFLFLQEAEFDPTEEGYIGMLYEIDLYRLSINSGQRRRPYFMEESIRCSDFNDPSEFYDKIIESNICIKRWYLNDGIELETGILSWANNRFTSRFAEIMIKSDKDRAGLLKHALDDTSEFVWSMDNVSSFHARQTRIQPGGLEPVVINMSDEDEALDDFLRSEDEEETEMTNEQRTLRWATTMGGATNL